MTNRPLVALILLAFVALTAAYQVPVTVDLSQPGLVLSGFHDLEGRSSPRPYRWTDGQARVWLAGIGGQPYHLVLTLSSARPTELDLPTTTVLGGDTLLGTFKAPRPVRDFPFDLATDTQSLSGDLAIQINSETFAPSGDLRTLGVIVYALRLGSISEPHIVWPAPLPLLWCLMIVALLYRSLCRQAISLRLAWPIAALVLALLCAGIAAARLPTVAALPWVILLASILFAISRATTLRRIK